MNLSKSTKHINSIISQAYQMKERYGLDVMMEIDLGYEGVYLNKLCFYKDVDDAYSIPYLLYRDFKYLTVNSPFMYHELEIMHTTSDGWNEPIISKYDEVNKTKEPYVGITHYMNDITKLDGIKLSEQIVYITLILGEEQQLRLDEGHERFNDTLYSKEIAYISLMNDFFSLVGLDERYAFNGKTELNIDTFKDMYLNSMASSVT